MRDSEMVASIVAGDAEGIAEAYDRYADSLFKYCRFLLTDPADAADAVQDTFVIAATRLPGLSEPDRLRAWLFAVARGECQRTLSSRKAAAMPSPDVTQTGEGGGSGIGEDAEVGERTGLRALIEDAVAGLSPAEREVIELRLWHGLEAAEIGAVLGRSRQHGQWVVSRASDQLQACLGVLLVGRARPADCADLGSMLDGWDGTLTPALRWWAHWHIKDCKTCTARRAAELSLVIPAGLTADAAIAAAAGESLGIAAGPPPALREHALALALGEDPSAVAYRAVLLGRAGSFGRQGFPRPPGGPAAALRQGGGKRPSRQIRTAAAVCVVLGAVSAVVAAALTGSSAPVKLAAGGGPVAAPTASAAATPSPSRAPAAAPSPGRPAASHTPRAASATSPAAGPTGAVPGTPPVPATTSPSASPSPTPSPTPSAIPTPSPSPSAGTLMVTPPGGKLQVSPFGATIRLTAQGGPVDWSIAVSGGSGHVIVHPSSGTLEAGQSVTVIIFASHHASGRQLTLSPGGTVFTIVSGFGGGFATSSPPQADLAVLWSPG
jgi:RNA polymerase sigma factor (sigma-70 family)